MRCLFLFLLGSFFFSCNHSNEKIVSDSIRHVDSFPAEGDSIFLSNPINFTFSKNEVFVSNQGTSTITIFDHDGNYIETLGKHGRGPGEFLNPHSILYSEGKLYVNDQGNGRFQRLDVDEGKSSSFPVKGNYYSYSIIDSLLYAYQGYPPSYRSKLDSIKLISVFNSKFSRMEGVGTFLNFTGNMIPDASISILKNYSDTVYSLTKAYPVVNKFHNYDNHERINLDGGILNYRKRVEANYDPSTFENDYRRGMKTLFTGFDVNRLGIFTVLYDDEMLQIDQFTFKGNFVKRFERKLDSEKYIVRDFKAVTNGGLAFYILNIEDGIPKIDLFKNE